MADTEASFAYEVKLDLGLPNPLMLGFGGDQTMKADMDALLEMIVEYGQRARMLRSGAGGEVGNAH